MATQLKIRRGTTAEHASFTGAEGEITLDTTKDTLVAHDNYTAGGRPMLREDLNNLANNTIDIAKLQLGSGTAYQVPMINAAGNALAYTASQIGQVKMVETGSSQTTSSNGTFVNASGLSIAITPRATSSRFVIWIALQTYVNTYGSIRLMRDSTIVGASPANTHGAGNGQGDPYHYIAMNKIDHPNTTNQVTYNVQIASYNGSFNMNSPSGSGASLCVMEIMDFNS
jgi:hypothetical protein